MPSAVFFHAEEGAVSFGRRALADYLAGDEGRLMRSLKSLLGTPAIDGKTEVLGRAVPFRDLLSMFVGELKKRAEVAAGRRFENAVLGRPVFFVDGDPAADRAAQNTLEAIAKAAGLANVEFQFEPIAAAFDLESRIDREQLVLVADIGGGTSDFTLVRLGPLRAGLPDRRDDILATGGVHIGGTDFDRQLSLAGVMPLFGLGGQLRNGLQIPSGPYFNLATWHQINSLYTRKGWTQLIEISRSAVDAEAVDRLLAVVKHRAGHWLAMQVEQAKIGLSEALTASLPIDRSPTPQLVMLDRAVFEAAILGLVDQIETTVRQVLRVAAASPEQVQTVFFTGGSSTVPLLREHVSRVVPSAHLVEGDLFESIGVGLALDAARRFG